MRDRIGWCAFGLGLVSIFGAPPARGQGAVAFQPGIGVANDGVSMGVTPAVSADRRYVRLSVGFASNTVTGFSTFAVPAAVGGGGLGFAGPGGLGGLAGMNGPLGGGFGPGVGGFGPGAGGYGPSAGFGPGAGLGSGGGLGLPGPTAPGAFAASPYGPGFDNPAAYRAPSRSQRQRAKAAKGALFKPPSTRPAATTAQAAGAGATAKPAPSLGAARTSP